MFKHILKLARTKILPKKSDTNVNIKPNNECTRVIEKQPRRCAKKTRKQLYFEQQCFKCCQLMKDIIPKQLLYPKKDLHIRHYSKNGYPWDMFCAKQQAVQQDFPPPEDTSCMKEAKETSSEKKCPPPEDTRCLEKPTETAVEKKCSTFTEYIKTKQEESKPTKTSSSSESDTKLTIKSDEPCPPTKLNNDSYGITFMQTKYCIRHADEDEGKIDSLCAARSKKSDMINQKEEEEGGWETKSASYLCKNSKLVKPSIDTHSNSTQKKKGCSNKKNKTCIAKACDVSKLMSTSGGCGGDSGGKRKTCIAKLCDASKLMSTSGTESCANKNPCGEPASMKKSQLNIKQFAGCSQDTSKSDDCVPSDCDVSQRSIERVKRCSLQPSQNPCGQPESTKKSQLSVKQFVSCQDLSSGGDGGCEDSASSSGRRGGSARRSGGCVAKLCDTSKLGTSGKDGCKVNKNPCGQATKTKKSDCEGSSSGSKICVAKKCEPSSGKESKSSSSCTAKTTKSVTTAESCDPGKDKAPKGGCGGAEAGEKDSSGGDDKTPGRPCLPSFGTPSKMNQFNQKKRKFSNLNMSAEKNITRSMSKCESKGNNIPSKPSSSLAEKCEKKVKCSVPCPGPAPVSDKCSKAIPTYLVSKKPLKRKKTCGDKKGFEFEVNQDKTKRLPCMVKRKQGPKKRELPEYPWKCTENATEKIGNAVAAEQKKKDKAEAERKSLLESQKPKPVCKFEKMKAKEKEEEKKRAHSQKSFKSVSTKQSTTSGQASGTTPYIPSSAFSCRKQDIQMPVAKDKRANTYPWNVEAAKPLANKKKRGPTLPRTPSLKTLKKMAAKNQNSLNKMRLLGGDKIDCSVGSGTKKYSTNCNDDDDDDDNDDGCKCLYCGAGVECKVCPGTCRAPKDDEIKKKGIKRDILCNLCHIFHTRGSRAMNEYFQQHYKNKEYHLYTDAAFLDLLIYLTENRLPQPSSKKKKKK